MNLFFKIKIFLLRIICYEKPLRVAFIKYLSLKFRTFRPHYESLILETAKNAKKLGYDEFSIFELGVAGGDGINSIIKYKKKIEQIYKIKIYVYGFDSGEGLPKVSIKEDLPFFWKEGDYSNKNILELEKKDKNVKIYKGDISDTLKNYISNSKIKVGLIFFDLDLYSSTKSFLEQLSLFSKANLLMPRSFCYFDDLFVADYCIDETNGEPLAIKEFNEKNSNLKLGKTLDHINDFKFPLAKGQIYTLHDYNNKDYYKYIGIYSSDSLSENQNLRSILND